MKAQKWSDLSKTQRVAYVTGAVLVTVLLVSKLFSGGSGGPRNAGDRARTRMVSTGPRLSTDRGDAGCQHAENTDRSTTMKAAKDTVDARKCELPPEGIAEPVATVPAVTGENDVACKMISELITASQAIARNDGDTGAALVNAGECFLIAKGTSVRVEVADTERKDLQALCVFIADHSPCLWMRTASLEDDEN